MCGLTRTHHSDTSRIVPIGQQFPLAAAGALDCQPRAGRQPHIVAGRCKDSQSGEGTQARRKIKDTHTLAATVRQRKILAGNGIGVPDQSGTQRLQRSACSCPSTPLCSSAFPLGKRAWPPNLTSTPGSNRSRALWGAARPPPGPPPSDLRSGAELSDDQIDDSLGGVPVAIVPQNRLSAARKFFQLLIAILLSRFPLLSCANCKIG